MKIPELSSPKSIAIGDVSLHYEVAGDGQNVILLHGSWSDLSTWDEVFPLLAQHCRVVSYDRRGHGRSTYRGSVSTFKDHVTDLERLVERLDLAPVYLCCSSSGGLIAMWLLGTRPDLVAGLIMHEPPAVGLLQDVNPKAQPQAQNSSDPMIEVRALLESGQNWQAAEKFSAITTPGRWDTLSDIARQRMATNASTFLDELNDPTFFMPDLTPIRQFQGRVLLTNGENSSPMFAAISAKLTAALPNVSHFTFKEASHVPHETDATDYANRIADWVNR